MKKNRWVSPLTVLTSFWRHRDLIIRMAKREVIGRYRGSMMGLLWSFFNPVLMLLVYTFFFSVIFQARWGVSVMSKTEFAVALFSGLIVYNLFAECINRAPQLIIANVNYVKKVVFPLEILPWVSLCSALFHALISTAVLLLFFLGLNHYLPWTIVYFPLVLVPFVFFVMGLSWFLAALGVFVRDVGQATGVFTSVMLFLSPIFYPVTALPEAYRSLLYLNPLTIIIDQARAVLIFGNTPHWGHWGWYCLISFVFAWLGLWWFQKTRHAFADVV